MSSEREMMDVWCHCGHTLDDHQGSDQGPCDECECDEFEEAA